MSNLLSKASILLTPTATSDGKLHNIKPNTTTGDFDFTRGTAATRVNSNGLIESVASGLPRIDFTGGTGQVLLEPASTNLFTYSQDLTNSDWSHNAEITVTASSELAPTGQLDANLVEFNGSGRSFIRQTFTVPSVATVSVFAKKGNWRYIGLRNFESSSNPHSVFDFDTNTFVNVSSGQSASFEILNNGWYRLQVTNPSPSSNTIAGFAITDATGNVLDPTGGQVANVHLFGCQVEEKSFVTSYIPTSGSAVTRNKDEANSSGDTSLINSTEGVLYGELASFTNSGEPERNISLSNSTANNTAEIGYSSGTNLARFRLRANNVTILAQNSAVSDTKQFIKIAIKYKSGEIKCFINGSQVISDTSSFTFSESLSELAFDRGNGSNEFNGKIKSIAVFKEALTDAQLISLTS